MSRTRDQTGSRNPMWKGGRVLASNGYVLLRVGTGHPLADVRGYAYEHRVVAEAMLGRPLMENEIPHHRDGNRTNNSPENLEVVSGIAEHSVRHRKHADRQMPGEVNVLIHCQCGCGQELYRFDPEGRPRRFISGHNMTVGRRPGSAGGRTDG
jgi:hypothetical protein